MTTLLSCIVGGILCIGIGYFLRGWVVRRLASRKLWAQTRASATACDDHDNRVEMAINSCFIGYITPYVDWRSEHFDREPIYDAFRLLYLVLLPGLAEAERLRQVYAAAVVGFELIGDSKKAARCQTIVDGYAREIEVARVSEPQADRRLDELFRQLR